MLSSAYVILCSLASSVFSVFKWDVIMEIECIFTEAKYPRLFELFICNLHVQLFLIQRPTRVLQQNELG